MSSNSMITHSKGPAEDVSLPLPKGTSSPLSAPPPKPMKTDTTESRKQIIEYCKSRILPNPHQATFMKSEPKSPTRVLAAALYCTLERKYFDERTTRQDIAVRFKITTAQLTKAITGVAYESGPHSSTKKCKIQDAGSSEPPRKKPQEPEEKEDTLSSSSSSEDLPLGLP